MAMCLILPAAAQAERIDRGDAFYGSVFGGPAWTGAHDLSQSGAAHLRGAHALPGYKDVDLVVDVGGREKMSRSLLSGAQIGYRFHLPESRVVPAVELEGLHFGPEARAHLANHEADTVAHLGTGAGQAGRDDPTSLVQHKYAAGEHRFFNRMRMDVGVAMLSGVLAYRTSSMPEPYIGLGAGLAHVAARRAVSHQTNPSGPVERTPDTGEVMNHFNSQDRASDTAWAWQAKAGLIMPLGPHLSAFVEYRWVHVGATSFTFGGTRYPGHAPTDAWRVARHAMKTQSGLAGLRYVL
jgi:opacity protein-like surface antigen